MKMNLSEIKLLALIGQLCFSNKRWVATLFCGNILKINFPATECILISTDIYMCTTKLFTERQTTFVLHIHYMIPTWQSSCGVAGSAMEFIYASPTPGEAYRDRRLTTNFEL